MKWRGLDYDKCTWESVKDLADFEKEKIGAAEFKIELEKYKATKPIAAEAKKRLAAKLGGTQSQQQRVRGKRQPLQVADSSVGYFLDSPEWLTGRYPLST